MCLFKQAILFKNEHFKTFTLQIFILKVNKLVKKLYITQHIPLIEKVKFKTDHVHFYKLYLLKCATLFKEQHFGNFENSNSLKRSVRISETYFFILHTIPLCKTEQYLSCFKTVSAKTCCFVETKSIFKSLSPQLFALKVSISMATLWKNYVCLNALFWSKDKRYQFF